ncbi:hypothetical protein KW843_22760 [Acidovorax sp. sif1233]|uniref:hypothetical protein n=1 Tax=Acidovorax sp. sif1233 TaxID=2854792 RepID=UPI001C491A30|nr:hypothetical protein [Acidovorax sp. sif1233]MBV7457320.1 hypothetical protein [Acidovorax sp. sif1233]
MGPELRLSIDVTVTGNTEGTHVAPFVNDALQELVNRMDFRTGTIQPGRAICHLRDHHDVQIRVDVYPLRICARRPA